MKRVRAVMIDAAIARAKSASTVARFDIRRRSLHQLFGFLPETLDERVRSAGLQERGKLGPPRRKLADRAGEIDVDDFPAPTRIAHQIIERDRLAVRLQQLRAHDPPGRARLADRLDFEAFSGVTIEAAGVGRNR